MRLPLLAALLLCSTTQAALINPLGGTWTDGTVSADYEEIPSGGPDSQKLQMLLNVADNSHFLSTVTIGDLGAYSRIWVDNSVDFYDGLGQVDGEFEFELTMPGRIQFNLSADPVFGAWLNNETSSTWDNWEIMPAGVYTLSFQVDSVTLNHEKRWRIVYTPVPEPWSVGIIMCLLWLLLWWRIG